ncbi:MAG TPA: hypothetical protein VNQ77_11735 [Frankiaceae bacterium]|nr:hypothetical protein [Frankiaceae bacterium]
MRFSSKQVVAMVAAGCAAVVLAPVGVHAATGQLVNVVDKLTGQSARVSTNGALLVENRAYPGQNAFYATNQRYQFGWIPLVSTVGPTRLAVTKLILAGPFDTPGNAGEVLVEAMVRTSGTLPCNGPGTAGYTRYTMLHLWVPARDTVQLDFAGQSLPIPHAGTGHPLCIGVTYFAGNTNMTIYATAVGFKYRVPGSS